MEHRLSARRVSGVAATLHSSRFGSAEGRIRNISRDGLFLETDVPLPANSFVEVEFTEPVRTSTCRIRGVVIHSKKHGVGLLTCDVEAVNR